MKKHLLYVSSTLPTPGMGSSVIIYRHLKRLKDWKISIVITEKQDVRKEYKIPESWNIITLPNRRWWWLPVKTRLPITFYLRLNFLRLEIEHALRKDLPQAVLNQFGKESTLALHLSKSWNAPLSIILHDLWEVWAKGFDAYFMGKGDAIKVLNHASRVWPVSPEIGAFYNLGSSKSRVLYPIPEGNAGGFAQWTDNFKIHPTMAFAGSFHDYYIDRFRIFAQALQKVNGTIIVITTRNEFVKSQLKDFSNIEYREPFAENIEVVNFLKERASYILVPGSIDLNAPGAKLSFRGGLVEFVHTGLPIIIVSPEGSALANWAKRHNWCAYLDSLDIQDASEFIGRIMNKQDWTKMAGQSKDMALNEFNPDIIQSQFESELARGER